MSGGSCGATVAANTAGDIAFNAAVACAIETSGLSRPITSSHHAYFLPSAFCTGSMSGSAQIGTATSKLRPTSTPENDAGVIPTIENAWPSR